MHRLRTASFLRRTTSEPHPRRRTSILFSYSSDFRLRELSGSLLDSKDTLEYHPSNPEFTWSSDAQSLSNIIFNKLNIFLIFLPAGIISAYLQWGDSFIFWFNFFALIPLARILSTATEELSLHTGDILGGLLSATLGNAVEMILTVHALRANLLSVVQGTLLGSILSNLLLVLGFSFFCGGLCHYVQNFNAQGTTYSMSLLLLACLGFITPTVALSENVSSENILTISRLTAIMIAITYCLFLLFQFGTHFSLFTEEIVKHDEDFDFLVEVPTLSYFSSIALLFITTLIISISSECFVSSIEGVSHKSGISESFIGVILLPIVGNAAEHITAVSVAMKNKPNLTISVAVGSSTQIALFMVPFSVLVGWGMGVPMTLAFSKVSAAVLTFSILIVIGVVQDGESNWLEGVMLIAAYCIIAIAFWFQDPISPRNL